MTSSRIVSARNCQLSKADVVVNVLHPSFVIDHFCSIELLTLVLELSFNDLELLPEFHLRKHTVCLGKDNRWGQYYAVGWNQCTSTYAGTCE